jgi:hypothetical protein
VIKLLLPVLVVVCCASGAQAESIGCTPAATVEWRDGKVVTHDYTDAEFGPTVFGLNLENGQYLEHLVGGRAGVTGGGTLDVIVAPDSSGRQNYVGVDREDGGMFRIDLVAEPMSFVRTHASGEVDIGTCESGHLIEILGRRP